MTSRPPTAPGDGDPGAARIAELELELAAARRTIDVLLDRLDERGAALEAAAGEGGAPDAARSPDGSHLASNLERVVRRRTRALAESEAQLRARNAELQQQWERRSEFIAIVAHELRTPLTSIVGYLDLLGEGRFGALEATMARPVRSLQRNAHRLKRLADEMLDAARLEARRVVLQRRPTDLAEVVGDVVAELGPLAQARQLAVAVERGPLRDVEADPDKVHQVVANLLLNAIRHAPEGSVIRVRIEEVPESEYPGQWARIVVRDDGPGIPAAHWERIFEPFSQLEPAKHHTSGPASAGLGLYITRILVELHGGLITVDSQVAQFTEFTVLLPVRA